jgi:hypothetical protein
MNDELKETEQCKIQKKGTTGGKASSSALGLVTENAEKLLSKLGGSTDADEAALADTEF